MPLRVSGKNLDIGEALRAAGRRTRLGCRKGKYFDGGLFRSCDRREGRHRLPNRLHAASGIGRDTAGRGSRARRLPELGQGGGAHRKRLRRYKRRLKDRTGSAERDDSREVEIPSYVIQAPDEEQEAETSEFHPVVIAETKKSMRTLSVSEAVMDLDLTGAPVVVFRHAGSGRVNMVYRRSDGNIGWIDPPRSAHATG